MMTSSRKTTGRARLIRPPLSKINFNPTRVARAVGCTVGIIRIIVKTRMPFSNPIYGNANDTTTRTNHHRRNEKMNNKTNTENNDLLSRAVIEDEQPGSPTKARILHTNSNTTANNTAEASLVASSMMVVAAQTGPSNFSFSPDSAYLTFIQSPPQQQQQRQQKEISENNYSKQQLTLEPKLFAIPMSSLQQKLQHSPITNPLHVQQTLMFPLVSCSHKTNKTTTRKKDDNEPILSLEEKLRRERQRIHYSDAIADNGIHTYEWVNSNTILLPLHGNVYIQHILHSYSSVSISEPFQRLYNTKKFTRSKKTLKDDTSAIDPQSSPNGQYVAFVIAGDIYMQTLKRNAWLRRLTFAAAAGDDDDDCIQHGLADFLSQEEMDRYRGFWWTPDSKGIFFTQVDESNIPIYRIMHQQPPTASKTYNSTDSPFASNNRYSLDTTMATNTTTTTTTTSTTSCCTYEDHRYPFAGCANPKIRLGYLPIPSIVATTEEAENEYFDTHVQWVEAPKGVSEYLTRFYFLPDGSALAQWQNRAQTIILGMRICYNGTRKLQQHILLEENTLNQPIHQWINLHHLYKPLKRTYYHNQCSYESDGTNDFSFLIGSEQSGYLHLYLYTYFGKEQHLDNDDYDNDNYAPSRAQLIRVVTSGEWMVEEIVGVNEEENVVYFTGTFNSPLERHLYAVPLTGTTATEEPACLTCEDTGMHTITMDAQCQYIIDSSSDLSRPPSVKVYSVHVPKSSWSSSSHAQNSKRTVTSHNNNSNEWLSLLFILHDASQQQQQHQQQLTIEPNIVVNGLLNNNVQQKLTPPQLISFPSSDGTELLNGALYLPDPAVYGAGPYPLACAVYGGPQVQRVQRSYNQCMDMRAQRLKSLGFAVLKCDNRGSSRRGVAFENSISLRLGQIEVQDQVAAVQYVVKCGVADPNRVGVYGWSYGGYLAAMCLCRAPALFRVAVAGAPVTSWDGYDTHYTERYMGLPEENKEGYQKSSILEEVFHLRSDQKLMIVHGLIDENVHFRHTERLINRLTDQGKDFDLLLFPEERHSPRRLRDRVYMEQQISAYFVKHLMNAPPRDALREAATARTTPIPEKTSYTFGSNNAKIKENAAVSGSNDYFRPIIRGHL